MNPTITFVVPVYNVPEKLLRQCIESILAQDCGDYELTLIDDGTPDAGGAICDAYADRERVRVIHQENAGVSAARNRGIIEGRGGWLCFVDGDDWIEPETVRFALDYIQKSPGADVLIWDQYYDVDGAVKKNSFVRGQTGLEPVYYSGAEKETLVDMFFPVRFERFEGNFFDLGTPHARIYRRAFLLENDLRYVPGLKRMQDNVFNLWVIERAKKIGYQYRHLYHYSYNPEAVTQKYTPDIAQTMHFLYECMKAYVTECHDNEEYHQRLYGRFLRIFGEIFKLNYANPENPKPMRERIEEAKKEFAREDFQEILAGFRPEGHDENIQRLHRMLTAGDYKGLIRYYTLSIRTRKLRTKLRGR